MDATFAKLYKIGEGLNTRFPDGNDPFMIVTPLAEECGEIDDSYQRVVDEGLVNPLAAGETA